MRRKWMNAEQTVLSVELSDGFFRVVEPTSHDWLDYSVAPGIEPYTPPPISAANVNRERDRRLAADFEFQGKMYQRDPTSLQRITGAATLAGFAVARGARTGDLEWAGNGAFGWIASDNTITPMDAQTCFAFGQAAAVVETRLIFAAKQLRSMKPIPADFADDKWWQ